MTHAKLSELIEAAGLSEFAEQLEWLMRDSIRFVPHTISIDDLEIGASRIGGVPDMPAGLSWPRWEEAPLSFIAQIRLSDLAHTQQAEIFSPQKLSLQPTLFDFEPQPIVPTAVGPIAYRSLPKTGMLYFFFLGDPLNGRKDWVANRDAWRVIYWKEEEVAHLDRTPTPAGPEEQEVYRVSFWSEMTLPAADSYDVRQLRLTTEQQEQYRYLLHSLEEAHGFPGFTSHRLLGYPEQIQNDMQEECWALSEGHYYIGRTGDVNIVSVSPTASKVQPQEWRLLIQIQNGWGGVLYYWIPDNALAQQDFSKAWAVLQYD